MSTSREKDREEALRREQARQVTADWRLENADRPGAREVDRLMVEGFLRACPVDVVKSVVGEVRETFHHLGYEKKKTKVAIGMRLKRLRRGEIADAMLRREVAAVVRQP